MAVPKQKKGRGAPKLPHHVCPNCGHYKDREVIVTE